MQNENSNSVQGKSYEELKRQQEIANETIFRLKDSGISPSAIYDVLIKKGIDPSIAQQAMLGAQKGGNASKELGRKEITHGIYWILGGAAMILLTVYAMAGTGGVAIITWGPIIFGIGKIIRGISRM